MLEAYWRQGMNLCYVPVPISSALAAQVPYPPYDPGKFYTSAQRLHDNPRIPHVSTPQPGDLVYFERTYVHSERITHVALVSGPGKMLGQQTPSLGYVHYMDGGWWQSRVVAYGRPER